MHTIEWDGMDALTWPAVRERIKDAYFTWEDDNGVKHEKTDISYIQACNELFEDAIEAHDRLLLYTEKLREGQSRKFHGAKKLTIDRITEHMHKHRRRLSALFWYLIELMFRWRFENNGKPINECIEVMARRYTEFEEDRSLADGEINKLKENYERLYHGDWKDWRNLVDKI